MRKREVRRDTGARAGREGEREETGAENVTRARGKEKETLIEMSVGNEGGAVKNILCPRTALFATFFRISSLVFSRKKDIRRGLELLEGE